MRRRVVLTAAGAAAVAAVGLLGDGAAGLVHRCVAADGVTQWLGFRLALLRHGDCPEGAFALGGDGSQVLALVACVAVPVLLTHLLGTVAGFGLVGRVRRALRHLLAVRRLPRRVRVVAAAVPRRPAVGATVHLRSRSGGSGIRLRAPPVPAAAHP